MLMGYIQGKDIKIWVALHNRKFFCKNTPFSGGYCLKKERSWESDEKDKRFLTIFVMKGKFSIFPSSRKTYHGERENIKISNDK